MGFKDHIDDEIENVFLNIEEFGETVQYNPAAGSVFDIKVIFDDAFEGIDTESGNVINSKQPKIVTKTSFFTNEPTQGDTVTRGSTVYKVSQHIPDGAGVSEILLIED